MAEQRQSSVTAGGGRGGRNFPEMKNKELKQRAVEFYAKHKVTDALEKLLNQLFIAAPNDVYGYMSEYFHELSLEPVISAFIPHEGLDGNSGRSVQVDLHCTVNGLSRCVSDSSVSLDLYPIEPDTTISPAGKATAGGKDSSTPKGAKAKGRDSLQGGLPDGEMSPAQPQLAPMRKDVDAFVSIQKYIAPALKGLSPKNQIQVDTAIIQQTALEDLRVHPSSTLACSCAVAVAGAQLLKTPLFLHLSTFIPPSLSQSPTTNNTTASQKASKIKSRFTMPIPIVSALGGGQLLIGKLRFREFCFTPLSGSPFPEQIKMLVNVHSELGKSVQGKAGVSGQATLPNGAYCPALDKPDQGLDLIKDACKNAGLQLNENIGVIIDVGVDKLFDQDKGKYELIAGQWKATDDIINMYSDLLHSYPGLLGFIDPLHHTDVKGWETLHEKLGNKCLLIVDKVLSKGLPLNRPSTGNVANATDGELSQAQAEDAQASSELPNQSGEGEGKEKTRDGVETASLVEEEPGLGYLSCAGIQFETTVWSTMQKAAALKGNSHYQMMTLPPNLTVNTVPADLAVAMRCRFIRMGAPTGVTNVLLSRLLVVREELSARKLNEPAKAHVFTTQPNTNEPNGQPI